MKTCPKCGAANEDDAVFCSKCGLAFPKSREPAQAYGGFCANCGERLEAGAQFCPNCGAPVRSGEKPPKSARGKKLAIVSAVVAAVVAVAVLAAVFLPGLMRSDAEDFIYYQQSLIAKPLTEALMSGVNSAASALNSDLTITVHTDDPAVGALLDGASIELRMKTEGGSFIANAVVNFMNAQLLTGTLTLDNGVLGFYLPQAKDAYYIMDLSKGRGEGGLDARLPSGIDAEKLAACLNKYIDILYSAVNEDDLTVEKKKTVGYIALDGSVKGTVYTFDPSAQDIERTFEALADALEKDEYLADLIYGFASASGEDVTRLEAASVLADAADGLRQAAARAGEFVEDSGFEWVLVMEGKTVRQVRLSANGFDYGIETAGRQDGDGESFAVFSSGDGEVTRLLSGQSVLKGGKISGSVTFDYEGGRLDMTFDHSQDEVSPLGLHAGKYEITVQGGDSATVVLEVSDAGDGSFDHRVYLRGGELGLVSDTTVNVNAAKGGDAQLPDAPVVDITNYSDEKLSELFYDIVFAILGDLGVDLDGMLGMIAGGSLL